MKRNLKKIFNISFVVAIVCALLSGFLFVKPKNNTTESAQAHVINTSSALLSELYDVKATFATEYNLSTVYPLSCENQTSSPFCWLYSTSKALESSFMVQRQEYYNVSEMGMAYLYFCDRVAASGGSDTDFGIDGTYYQFVSIMQQHGLIAESDCSNDLYGVVNDDNYQKFSYISDYADTELSSQINAFSLGDNDSYKGLSSEAKQIVIKNYLLNYGGLFAGLGPGVLFNNGNKSFYVDDLDKEGDDAYEMNGNHALCLIGWSDTVWVDDRYDKPGGFLLMNSWGLESNAYEYFYVSYECEFFYNTLAGFVFDDLMPEETPADPDAPEDVVVTPKVVTGETSARGFKTDVYTSSDLNNVFCYDDARVVAEYVLDVDSLDSISVKISSGRVDYTSKFKVTYYNATKSIEIYLVDDDDFYGGYYSIKFYQNGTKLCQKGIYVYSATEVGYFKLRTADYIDSYMLMNSYLETGNTSAMYISSTKMYFLHFNLTSMNEYLKLKETLNYKIVNASAKSTTNAAINAYTSDYIISRVFTVYKGDAYDLPNDYYIKLDNLGDFANCFLSFSIQVDSMLYSGISRTYNFDVFISSRPVKSVEDENGKTVWIDELHGSYINYEINGGLNHADNITMMPNYVIDGSLPSVELKAPTKAGYEFAGWYLNPSYTGGAVTTINSSMMSSVDNGVLSLYAKWQSTELDYFEVSAGFDGATDYNDNPKDIADGLIYGDSLKIKLVFTELDDLRTCDYTLLYYFYINGTVSKSENLSQGSQNVVFNVNFPDLKSGDYVFKVKVVVVIDNTYTKEEEISMSCSVGKKLVEFEFSGLTHEYDGQSHKPVISVKDGSFYDEDLVGVELSDLYNLSDNTGKVNASSYNYSIVGLNNENYYYDPAKVNCTMVINKKAVTVESWTWDASEAVYDKKEHRPQPVLGGIVGADIVTVLISETEFVYAGTYQTNVVPESISNSNYYVVMGSNFEYTIKKAQITITIDNTTDRYQIEPVSRTKPTYTVYGVVYENALGTPDDLGITIINEADSATTSGKYKIDCTISNPNYEATVITGVYTLTGKYKVYYHLPNGEVYIETVEEGELPKGVTENQMKLETFQRIKYSHDLNALNADSHVSIEVEDYSGQVFIVVFGVIFVGLCLLVYFKKRKTGVR